MANNRARGNGNQQNKAKQNDAKTANGAKPDISTHAGSGGRGGHRRRKGGQPQG